MPGTFPSGPLSEMHADSYALLRSSHWFLYEVGCSRAGALPMYIVI